MDHSVGGRIVGSNLNIWFRGHNYMYPNTLGLETPYAPIKIRSKS